VGSEGRSAAAEVLAEAAFAVDQQSVVHPPALRPLWSCEQLDQNTGLATYRADPAYALTIHGGTGAVAHASLLHHDIPAASTLAIRTSRRRPWRGFQKRSDRTPPKATRASRIRTRAVCALSLILPRRAGQGDASPNSGE
jgi:hypothetical protein